MGDYIYSSVYVYEVDDEESHLLGKVRPISIPVNDRNDLF